MVQRLQHDCRGTARDAISNPFRFAASRDEKTLNVSGIKCKGTLRLWSLDSLSVHLTAMSMGGRHPHLAMTVAHDSCMPRASVVVFLGGHSRHGKT